MADWYYTNSGQRIGPVPDDHMRQLVSMGSLQPTDLVWRQGMPQWAAVSNVAELYSGGTAAPMGGQGFAPAAVQQPYGQPVGVSYATGGGGHSLTPMAVSMLRATKPWVRFLSVLWFIAIGLQFLAAIVIIIAGSARSSLFAEEAVPQGFFYLAMGVIYIFPALFLSKYASRIDAMLTTGRNSDLEGALESQKSFWKFMGILAIVFICLSVVLVIAFIALASGSARF